MKELFPYKYTAPNEHFYPFHFCLLYTPTSTFALCAAALHTQFCPPSFQKAALLSSISPTNGRFSFTNATPLTLHSPLGIPSPYFFFHFGSFYLMCAMFSRYYYLFSLGYCITEKKEAK